MKRYSYKFLKRPKKKSHARTYFFIFLFLAILGGAFYFFWFWPGFKIKNITLASEDFPLAEDFKDSAQSFLSEERFSFLPQDKIFTFPAQKLRDFLKKEFPEARKIIVQKRPPDEIRFEIERREKLGIWCQKNSGLCYFFDKEGVIFLDSPQMTSSLYLTIFCGQDKEIFLGDEVIDPAELEKVIQIKKLSDRSNFLNLVSLQNYQAGALELEFTSSHGWRAIFDAQEDLAKQVHVLAQTLEKEIKDRGAQLDYIDLRVKNRAYYKYKEAENKE